MKMPDVPPAVLDSATLNASDRALAGDRATIALSALPVGDFATIHSVLPARGDADSSEVDRDLVLRLIEIGFVPGERVRVIAVGHPGHQPLAVRLAAADGGRRNLNGSTFAMRRHEADFIRVVPDLEAR
jgi:ferrous iron transport protein A